MNQVCKVLLEHWKTGKLKLKLNKYKIKIKTKIKIKIKTKTSYSRATTKNNVRLYFWSTL